VGDGRRGDEEEEGSKRELLKLSQEGDMGLDMGLDAPTAGSGDRGTLGGNAMGTVEGKLSERRERAKSVRQDLSALTTCQQRLD